MTTETRNLLHTSCASSQMALQLSSREGWCCSVSKLCQTLWDPVDCSTPGFPVFHYLPEIAQTHVHWVSDAIQPSHPLSPLSPLALNLYQHQSLFQWAGSSHQVAKVLELYHQPCNEYLGLIFLIIDWFDLVEFQRTLKSLLQYPLLFTKSCQFYLNIKIAYYTSPEPIFMQSHSLSFIFSIL